MKGCLNPTKSVLYRHLSRWIKLLWFKESQLKSCWFMNSFRFILHLFTQFTLIHILILEIILHLGEATLVIQYSQDPMRLCGYEVKTWLIVAEGLWLPLDLLPYVFLLEEVNKTNKQSDVFMISKSKRILMS